MWKTNYTVKGSGQFPLDMLRYDQSFPASGEAVIDMSGDWDTDLREIKLGRYTKVKDSGIPTEGRWSSFGWFVVTDSIEQERIT